MRRDLAPFSDVGVLLNLDERADLGMGADRTAVQVHQVLVKDHDTFAERHVR
jgi:hypothetical protein